MKRMQLFQACSGSPQKLASSYRYSNSGCMGNKNLERKEESGRAHWRQKSRGSAVAAGWSLQGPHCLMSSPSQRPRVTFTTFGFYITSPNYFLMCAPISSYQVWVLFYIWTSISYNIWPSRIQIVLFQTEYSFLLCIEHGFLGFPSTMSNCRCSIPFREWYTSAINWYTPSPTL